MKTALTYALATVAAMVFAAGAQAAEGRVPFQQPQPCPMPAMAEQPPTSGAPGPDGAGPQAGPVADGPGVDSGLWDGAPIGEGCSLCGGGCCNPPDWYTEQGVRFFGRTKPRQTILGYEPTFPSGFQPAVLSDPLTSQFGDRTAAPGMSAAYNMTIGHYFARDTLNRDHFVEFTFWGLNRFQDEGAITASQRIREGTYTNIYEFGNLYSPYSVSTVPNNILTQVAVRNGTIVPGFDQVDQMSTYYASYMNNFELNGKITPRGEEDQLVLHPDGKWRKECRPGRYISYLYGLRFMKLDESFRFHGQGLTKTFDTNGTLLDSVNNSGEYDVSTHNNLLGLQLGADMEFRQCRWSWGVRAKVGPYINFADQVSDIAAGVMGEDPTFSHHLTEARHNAALVGEVGFTATYKFRPNLIGRASYDFMWVTGLALAPEQLQFSTNPVDRINTNGTAVFNGPSLGLEWLW
ncbi:MAG: BBP7 family outer membrane beta-barrel protein [Thermoguttaceae bacterium]